jgi:hypothetical protein
MRFSRFALIFGETSGKLKLNLTVYQFVFTDAGLATKGDGIRLPDRFVRQNVWDCQLD